MHSLDTLVAMLKDWITPAALIYFAGRLSLTVQMHDKWITAREEKCAHCERVIAVVENTLL